jgi:MarR family transcriptional regulator for hemolysin
MVDLKQDFMSSLFNARNRVRFAMDDQFRPIGITDATWRTLFYLNQTGDGVQQKQLARTMGIEGPSLVRLLDNLEGKNFIERKSSLEDRRSKTIHLTDSARQQLATLQTIAADVRKRLLEDVSSSDLETCIKVFKKILDTETLDMHNQGKAASLAKKDE